MSRFQQPLYRVAVGTDRRDITFVDDAYTTDAVWTREFKDGGIDIVLDGRDAIREYMLNLWEANPPATTHHLISNILIERDGGDELELSSYKTLVKVIDGKPVVASSGRYRDVVVESDGVWQIRSRVLIPVADL